MMKQFMHVGVPTDKIMEGAVYAEAIKTYIVAPELMNSILNTCVLRKIHLCRKNCRLWSMLLIR